MILEEARGKSGKSFEEILMNSFIDAFMVKVMHKEEERC
jgi:hypothetical protein